MCSSYYVLVVTVTVHVYTTQSLAHVDTHVVRRTTLSFGFTITSMSSMTQLTWCLAAIVGPRRSETVSPVVLSTTDGRMTAAEGSRGARVDDKMAPRPSPCSQPHSTLGSMGGSSSNRQTAYTTPSSRRSFQSKVSRRRPFSCCTVRPSRRAPSSLVRRSSRPCPAFARPALLCPSAPPRKMFGAVAPSPLHCTAEVSK